MTTADLLALLLADEAAPVETDNADLAPLTFAQQRLWFLQRYEPQSVAYNLTRAFRLGGALQADALERAFRLLIARHAILRTRFEPHDGEPRQRVLSQVPFELAIEDLSAQEQGEQALAARLRSEVARAFDLSAAPLLRATLLRLGDTEHVLLLAMHHIVSDAWSNPILARDLSAAYRAALAGQPQPDLPPLPMQYADHARRQRARLAAGGFDAALAQARAHLGDEVPVLDLPTDRPRPARASSRGARVRRLLPDALAQALRDFCRTERCTPFVVLLAAWQALLARCSGQCDFAIGVPHAGRAQWELEELVGFFVNTQVVRARITPELSTRALCRRLAAEARAALDHAELPFELLLEHVPVARDASRTPLFQVMFNLQTLARPVVPELAGLQVQPLALDVQAAKFDLTLDIAIVGDKVRCELEYNADLFEPASAQRIAGHFETLLAAMLARTGECLDRLPLLDAQERETALVACNDTACALGAGDDMLACFERRVREAPERVAAVFGETTLDYHELNRRANRMARWLREHGVRRDHLVAVCLDREPDLLVTLLAIHKAGGAYLPIDAAQPAARNALILRHAAPALVITSRALHAAVQGVDRVIVLDDCRNAIAACADSDLGLPVHPRQLAYVLYTSGSTGRPKGVQIEREAFGNFLKAMHRHVPLAPHDRLLAVTTLGFDIAGLELFLPLMQGACVVVASREQALRPQALLALMQAHAVTVMQATPASWQMLVEHDGPAWQGLRLLCGGEALPAELAQRLLARGATVLNLYGPTETTVWSAAWPVREVDAPTVPIGRPIANNRLYVLDAQLEPVPPGVVGELYIGGAGLARGYLKSAGLTAAAFVPNPFGAHDAPGAQAGSRLYRTGDLARRRSDGVIEFAGRRDQQVKLRGFRVELGEVDAALLAHPGVRQAVATLADAPGGQPALVAHCVAKEGATIDPDTLTAWLRERLPAYMLPSRFVLLDALPLNANGKVDRKALPAPRWASEGDAPPATPTEQALAAIWHEVLGVSPQATDDVFALGAQSLQLVRIQALVQQRLGRDVPLADLFGAPTLRAMAARIDAAGTQAQADLERLDALLQAFE